MGLVGMLNKVVGSNHLYEADGDKNTVIGDDTLTALHLQDF